MAEFHVTFLRRGVRAPKVSKREHLCSYVGCPDMMRFVDVYVLRSGERIIKLVRCKK